MRISDWSSDVCSSDLAGTGLRPLGKQLCQNGALEADIFLTHTHHDHIVGLPFFAPLFDKRNRIRLWAGHLIPELTLHDVLVQFMNAPLFPVPPKIFAAKDRKSTRLNSSH